MRSTTWIMGTLFIAAWATVACDDIEFEGDPDAGTDTDTDTDADTDSDTDTDVDTDTDADTDTDDVLVSFDFGYGSAEVGLHSGYVVSTFAGLECVIADTQSDDSWSLALVNFSEVSVPPDLLSGVPFAGTANTTISDALAVSAIWQHEEAMGAPPRTYYFEYVLTPFSTDGALDLEITIEPCTDPECDEPARATSLDLMADTPVFSCRYGIGSESGWYDMSVENGALYGEPSDGGCNETALVVHSVDTAFAGTIDLCLWACSGDSTSCPHPEVETCDGTACVIEEPLTLTEI
jgi:hypothetical protein